MGLKIYFAISIIYFITFIFSMDVTFHFYMKIYIVTFYLNNYKRKSIIKIHFYYINLLIQSGIHFCQINNYDECEN